MQSNHTMLFYTMRLHFDCGMRLQVEADLVSVIVHTAGYL